MDLLTRLTGTHRALKGWLLASLLCNMGIIVTGAVVRLTGSGLGCPTWPRCTADSYVPHGEMGIHGLIEFGNRLLTFVLLAAAIGALVAAYRASSDTALRTICWAVLTGIAGQGILGGITVRMQLNPYIVGLHLLGSIALIVGCTWGVLRAWGWRPVPVGRGQRWLTHAVFWVSMLAIYLGTLVTGSGPHSGDQAADRTGFDIEYVARLHALSVWALVGLCVAAWLVFARAGSRQPMRAVSWLFYSLLAQGGVGYLQYFLGLPVGVVIAHMIGTTVVTVLAAVVLFSNRTGEH
ncbi:MAG: COX15/CtaA family protein [Propionibacteriaceae bacterium]|nr:COX15/CtaA family protein [Propionibacteriaceae bacterium]